MSDGQDGSPDPRTSKREDVKAALKPIKDQVRKLIDANANQAGEMAPNHPDPHTPIIAVLQMALIQAAVEYLLVCGCTMPEAVQKATQTTGNAMEIWLRTIYQMGQKQ